MIYLNDKVTAIVHKIKDDFKISIKYIYNIELKLHQHYNQNIVDAY